MKTFGALRKEGERWVVSAQADIATRLKRIFPRVQATRLGDIRILDSLEVCRDLEWVLDRWPMEISEGDRKALTRGANGHRDQQEHVTAILEGGAKHAAYRPVLYTGTESSAAKSRAFDSFCEGDSRVLMLSLRSGAGLDGLQESCQVVLFGELDWSPGVHKQVLGRLHRPGQRSPVTGYFCVSDYGADPAMMDTLDLKKLEAELLVNGGEADDGKFEEIDSRTKQDHLREMAVKALRDTHGTRKEALVAS